MNGEMPEEMFSILKSSIDNTMNMLTMVQDQNEKVFSLVVEHTDETQSAGKKLLNEWISKGKESQAMYQKVMEDNLGKLFPGKGKAK